MSASWQLRAYKVFARLFQKPLLAFARPQSLARHLFTLNAVLTHERPKGVVMDPAEVGGVPGAWVETERAKTQGIILFVHGGAFVIGSLRAYRTLVARIGQAAGRRSYVVQYRLAPEHPFPAGLEDVVAAYKGLLSQGHAPSDIALCGDSAGGCLIFGLLQVIAEGGLPMPSRVGLMSPITDLRGINPSLTENQRKDPLVSLRWGQRGQRDYLAGQDPSDPRISPVLGEYAGCPPVMIQVGSDEVMRADSVLMADHLTSQGVETVLNVWSDVPHVWHFMSRWVLEADAGIAELGAFLKA